MNSGERPLRGWRGSEISIHEICKRWNRAYWTCFMTIEHEQGTGLLSERTCWRMLGVQQIHDSGGQHQHQEKDKDEG